LQRYRAAVAFDVTPAPEIKAAFERAPAPAPAPLRRCSTDFQNG